MKTRELKLDNMPVVEVKGVKWLDVGKTFDCGQCFRFDAVPETAHESEYAGVAFGRHVSFATEGDALYVYNSDLADFECIWRGYLDLDRDYDEINEDILQNCKSEVMAAAIEQGRGIRILRQDAYEAVISFIVSQNNNIPRIKKIIENTCERYGNEIVLSETARKHSSGKSSLRSFPEAKLLLEIGESGLFELRTGFRAKYIYDAVSRISDGRLDVEAVARAESTDECIGRLCEVKGIGPKVASCAALFGMGRYDAFPVDVWIKRVGEKYFPEVKDFSGRTFGRFAGIAQQYLFYYERYPQTK